MLDTRNLEVRNINGGYAVVKAFFYSWDYEVVSKVVDRRHEAVQLLDEMREKARR